MNSEKEQKNNHPFGWLLLFRHRPIFPGRFQPSIFGTVELNYCVRDGNRWDLYAKDTEYSVLSVGFSLTTLHIIAQNSYLSTPFFKFFQFFLNFLKRGYFSLFYKHFYDFTDVNIVVVLCAVAVIYCAVKKVHVLRRPTFVSTKVGKIIFSVETIR